MSYGLTIGQVAEATDMSPQLLRTWETRHGFPRSVRMPSGHRRYDPETIEVIKRVRAAQAAGLRLDQAIQRNTDVGAGVQSIYATLKARYPSMVGHRVRKGVLVKLSHAIEDECRARAGRPMLVGCFQSEKFYEAVAPRWEELARVSAEALVMADFAEHDDDGSPSRVALPSASPILSEWILVFESTPLTAMLAAWEVPGQEDVPSRERVYETIWTTDGTITREALSLAAAAATSIGSQAGERLSKSIRETPPPPKLNSEATTAILNRVLAYVDMPA